MTRNNVSATMFPSLARPLDFRKTVIVVFQNCPIWETLKIQVKINP